MRWVRRWTHESRMRGGRADPQVCILMPVAGAGFSIGRCFRLRGRYVRGQRSLIRTKGPQTGSARVRGKVPAPFLQRVYALTAENAEGAEVMPIRSATKGGV